MFGVSNDEGNSNSDYIYQFETGYLKKLNLCQLRDNVKSVEWE